MGLGISILCCLILVYIRYKDLIFVWISDESLKGAVESAALRISLDMSLLGTSWFLFTGLGMPIQGFVALLIIRLALIKRKELAKFIGSCVFKLP